MSLRARRRGPLGALAALGSLATILAGSAATGRAAAPLATPRPETASKSEPAVSRFDVLALARSIRPRQEGERQVWEYRLVIGDSELRLADGRPYKVWSYNGLTPGPTLIAREGDGVRITLVNETANPHTLHSHGLFVPARMDGVPHALDHEAAGGEGHHHDGVALPFWTQPVQPGESYTYEYIARPSGTHWYHCHVNTNEHLDRGMSGALIVLPRVPEPAVDVDRVLLLDEWNSRYAQTGTPGNPRETGDYDFFTINGQSFPNTEAVYAEPGKVVRLRLINAGAQLHFMHLHGHTFLVTHKDGRPLTAIEEMDTVEIGPGERIDLLIPANNPGVWCFHCHESPHVTNGGKYPGGMLMHLQVGPVAFPDDGDGPVGPGIKELRRVWMKWRQKLEAS